MKRWMVLLAGGALGCRPGFFVADLPNSGCDEYGSLAMDAETPSGATSQEIADGIVDSQIVAESWPDVGPLRFGPEAVAIAGWTSGKNCPRSTEVMFQELTLQLEGREVGSSLSFFLVETESLSLTSQRFPPGPALEQRLLANRGAPEGVRVSETTVGARFNASEQELRLQPTFLHADGERWRPAEPIVSIPAVWEVDL